MIASIHIVGIYNYQRINKIVEIKFKTPQTMEKLLKKLSKKLKNNIFKILKNNPNNIVILMNNQRVELSNKNTFLIKEDIELSILQGLGGG